MLLVSHTSLTLPLCTCCQVKHNCRGIDDGVDAQVHSQAVHHCRAADGSCVQLSQAQHNCRGINDGGDAQVHSQAIHHSRAEDGSCVQLSQA